MENYIEVIAEIKNTLRRNNYESIANEINDLQLSGGTAGERFIAVVHFLNSDLRQKTEVYQLIKSNADKLIDFAYELNYLKK